METQEKVVYHVLDSDSETFKAMAELWNEVGIQKEYLNDFWLSDRQLVNYNPNAVFFFAVRDRGTHLTILDGNRHEVIYYIEAVASSFRRSLWFIVKQQNGLFGSEGTQIIDASHYTAEYIVDTFWPSESYQKRFLT